MSAYPLAMEYEWMAVHKCITPNSCAIIHDHSHVAEYFIKLATVCKIGVKYYLFFHIIPFLLRLRRCTKAADYRRVLFKTIKDYIKSIFFMGFLVTNSKGALCVNNSLGRELDPRFFAVSSFFSGTAIWWEEAGRRQEIGYFILAKALRSIYINLKRTGIFNIGNNEAQMMHILLFGTLCYIYQQNPQILKYKETFQMLWGKD